MTVTDKLRDYIISDLNHGSGTQDITPDQSLVASGLLDSISILQLLDFLEGEFNVQIKMDDVTTENFDSLQIITQLLASYGVPNA